MYVRLAGGKVVGFGELEQLLEMEALPPIPGGGLPVLETELHPVPFAELDYRPRLIHPRVQTPFLINPGLSGAEERAHGPNV